MIKSILIIGFAFASSFVAGYLGYWVYWKLTAHAQSSIMLIYPVSVGILQ